MSHALSFVFNLVLYLTVPVHALSLLPLLTVPVPCNKPCAFPNSTCLDGRIFLNLHFLNLHFLNRHFLNHHFLNRHFHNLKQRIFHNRHFYNLKQGKFLNRHFLNLQLHYPTFFITYIFITFLKKVIKMILCRHHFAMKNVNYVNYYLLIQLYHRLQTIHGLFRLG